MVGVKHHTQSVLVNDPAKEISKNAWNEAHDADAIADVLTDHNLGAHTALGLSTALDVPTGSIIGYGGAAAPSGYVLCDGTSYDRVGAYAALFAVISTAYGSVDIDHFTVPDLRSKFPLGKGGALALGNTGGATTYTHSGVTISDHATNAHTHPYGTITAADHAVHLHPVGTLATNAHTGSTKTLGTATGVPFTGPSNHTITGSTGNNAATQAHSMSGSTGDASAALAHTVTSSGADHTGVQPPYQVVNYIIKT